MRNLKTKGFTLIELLVVIAIIGILAAIILVSLGNARQKGGLANVQSNLGSIRRQAELFANNNGTNTYGATQATTTVATGSVAGCGSSGMWADPTILQATKSAIAQVTTGGQINGTAGQAAVCVSKSDYWAVAVFDPTSSSQLWCVDSIGRSKSITQASVNAANSFAGCI